ncbi:hypothetical protein ACWGJB_06725 [Streptomyces sp. NPDC054813]
MGGSAKPRRPRAAPAALRYRQTGRKAGRKKGDALFGCLGFLVVAGVTVLLALIDMVWGDGVWRWAARNWPGGAYAFAVCLGIAAPVLFALAVWSADGAGPTSWKTRPGRAAARTALALLAAGALVPFLSLAFNAVDDGKGKHRTGPPSWVFSHYPWLWALGIASTLAAAVGVVWTLVLLIRRSDAART